MKTFTTILSLIALISLSSQCNKTANPGSNQLQDNPGANNAFKPEMWLTNGYQTVLLQIQDGLINYNNLIAPTIIINDAVKYQTIDGFGYTLTGGSAQLLHAMNEADKSAILNELYGIGNNSIGVSYVRLSMGASDLDGAVFSYNDLPAGHTDINQDKFSIDKDKANLIPILKKILLINPNIKILATPWSPPTWMKDNDNSKGGSLKPEYYNSYAKYFVKYIQAMKAEGITIDAITPQNEPLHPGNNPSMFMLAEQQRDFIKNALGPAFRTAGLTTKIIIYDHNLDRPDYPETILKDADAAQYVDGSAFHLYAGDINTMGALHDAYPSKNVYFTEQWTGANGTFHGDLLWHTKNVIIGSMRNWAKVALEWNLAADPSYNPHTPGGCTECKGALTINGNTVLKNVGYYIIAHASKFVPPGSIRIESNSIPSINQVAFITPSGKRVMLAVNESATSYSFNLKHNNKWAAITVPAASVATLIW